MTKDWQPVASLTVLKLRARLLKKIRAFFDVREVMEVETPVMSLYASPEVHLNSFYAHTPANRDKNYYLQTSPEFAMKRLLAAGSGAIYQINHVFRAGESGAQHNPEFTLLEWYQPGYTLQQLINEVVALFQDALQSYYAIERVVQVTYSDLFKQVISLDPLSAELDTLQALFEQYCGQKLLVHTEIDKDGWLDLIMTHIIQPQLQHNTVTVVTDYPATQASLARLNPNNFAVAERFEVFVGSMELANGFYELGNADELRQRFEQANQVREQLGLPQVELDERFLAALDKGLPECCGVALGLDRLVMLASGVDTIQQVISFPIDRA